MADLVGWMTLALPFHPLAVGRKGQSRPHSGVRHHEITRSRGHEAMDCPISQSTKRSESYHPFFAQSSTTLGLPRYLPR